jgi:hypothetical protein
MAKINYIRNKCRAGDAANKCLVTERPPTECPATKCLVTKCPAAECPATDCLASECPMRLTAHETQCPMVIECPKSQNQFKSNQKVVASYCRPFGGA